VGLWIRQATGAGLVDTWEPDRQGLCIAEHAGETLRFDQTG